MGWTRLVQGMAHPFDMERPMDNPRLASALKPFSPIRELLHIFSLRRNLPPPEAITAERFAGILHHRFSPHLKVGVLLNRRIYGLLPEDLEALGQRLLFLGHPEAVDGEMTLFEAGALAETFTRAMAENPGCEGAPLFFSPRVGGPVYALPEKGFFPFEDFLILTLTWKDRVA